MPGTARVLETSDLARVMDGGKSKVQEIDGTTILSQQQGYRLLNKKRILDDN